MSYRGREGWHTDTNSIISNGADVLPAQAPQHPIPTMQGAFEESIVETAQDSDNDPKDLSKIDVVGRRRMLLEQPEYERTVAGRWKQKTGENFHPLWKLVAQISFGMHLLHQGLAKSDEEVIKILQTHVDEIDGFLERTTEDLDLAQRDIEERIRYLKLPLEHGDVFDNMLGDRKFRNAIVEGNEKIEHIVDRTGTALRDTLKDVKKGYEGTRELSRYFKKLDSTWEHQTEEYLGVYAAMMGNTEGWSGAYAELQRKGDSLHESLVELSSIIAEIQRRVGIASRKNLPSAPGSRSNTQPPSRANSIYAQSTPQSPTKPHITSAIGTGMRNREPNQRGTNDKWAQSYAGDRWRSNGTGSSNGQAESNTSSHSRRGSDDSTNKRVSFSEKSNKRFSGDSWRRESGSHSKRHSKDKSSDGLKTSWFRKSSASSTTSSTMDKRKSQSTPQLSSPIQTPYDIETGVRTARAPVSKPLSREGSLNSTSNPMSPMRMSESIGIQSSSSFSWRAPRDQIPDDAIEEVDEDEIESDEEPEPEIIQASQIEQKPAENINLPKEVTITNSSSTANQPAQKPQTRDLPLRHYKSTDSLPEGRDAKEKGQQQSEPTMAETIASLKRASTFSGTSSADRRASDGRPEPLRVSQVSTFAPFGKTPTGSTSQHSSESGSMNTTTPRTKRPANLKLFPTIPPGRAMSPGPQTAPLDKTTPLFPTGNVTPPIQTVRDDQLEKLPKMPQTPAERGRSPPPPERVPTPPHEKRSISPSLRALTSATVSGPEPDYPFGFGDDDGDEGEQQEPFIAELSARPATADGGRDSSIERTAELGAESPAIKPPKTSPFIDPEEKKEEMAARQREREMRLEEEKRKVQEQIVSKVKNSIVVDSPRREAQYGTGDTRQLHAPPIVSPPQGSYPYPKHSPLNVAQSATSLHNTNYDLPYSKLNTTPLKDRRKPWKRFFRFGRFGRSSRTPTIDAHVDEDTVSMGSVDWRTGEPKPKGKKFSLSLPFRGLHRRKRSKDMRINTSGGLQPFGSWGPVSRGMSWSDTRRGSDAAGNGPPRLNGLNGNPSGHDGMGADSQPVITPRPEHGTLSIPGVGTMDFSRASAYVRLERENQAQLQNLLLQQADREEAERQKQKEDEELAQLVVRRKEQDAAAAATTAAEQQHAAADGETPSDETPGSDIHAPNATVTTLSAAEKTEPLVAPTLKPEEPTVQATTEVAAAAAERPLQPQHQTEHSPKPSSERSGTTESRSNATSSLMARKSDATPNTGLSLMLSPSLTSELLGHGTSGEAGTAVAHDPADVAAPAETSKAAQVLGISYSTSVSSTRGISLGARSPALGADVNPMETAKPAILLKDKDATSPVEGKAAQGGTEKSPAASANAAAAEVESPKAERPVVAEDLLENGINGTDAEHGAENGEGLSSDGKPTPIEEQLPIEGTKLPEFLDHDPIPDGPVRDPVRERNGTPF